MRKSTAHTFFRLRLIDFLQFLVYDIFNMSRHYNNLPPQHQNNENNGGERQPLPSRRTRRIGAAVTTIATAGALFFGGKEVYNNFYVQPETGITNVEADNQGEQYRDMVASILDSQRAPYSFDESGFSMKNVTEDRRAEDPNIGENETIYAFDNDKEVVDSLYRETGVTHNSVELRHERGADTASLTLISDFEKRAGENSSADRAEVTTTYQINRTTSTGEISPYFDEENPKYMSDGVNAALLEDQLKAVAIEDLKKLTIDADHAQGSFTYDGESASVVPLESGEDFSIDKAAVDRYAQAIAKTSNY